MFARASRQERQLSVARDLFNHLGELLDSRISIRLWDGSVVPLGSQVESGVEVSLSGPGVIGSLLRRPTPDNLLRHFVRPCVSSGGCCAHWYPGARSIS